MLGKRDLRALKARNRKRFEDLKKQRDNVVQPLASADKANNVDKVQELSGGFIPVSSPKHDHEERLVTHKEFLQNIKARIASLNGHEENGRAQLKQVDELPRIETIGDDSDFDS